MRPISLALLNLIYPPKCIYCAAVLPSSARSTCKRCAASLPWLSQEESIQRGKNFSECLSAAPYEARFRNAMLQYKFNGQKHLSELFSKAMARRAELCFTGRYDVITWLPLSKQRRKLRGYDQSQRLAEGVARHLHMRAHALLVHPLPKKAQSSLRGVQARRNNVKGCFVATSPARIANARILLVDDIITTGASLEEAAGCLLQAGAAEVLCLTFCRTPTLLQGERDDNPLKL